MKKWLAIIITIVLIIGIVIKIGQMMSIGTIGGADGPTAIFVAGSTDGSFMIGFLFFVFLLLIASIIVTILKRK